MKLKYLVSVLCSIQISAAFGGASLGIYTQDVHMPYIQPMQNRMNQVFPGGGSIKESLDDMRDKINRRISNTTPGQEGLEQKIIRRMTESDQKFINNMSKTTSMLVTQIKAIGEAQIKAKTAIADHKEQERIRQKINDVARDLEQPSTNCLQLASGQYFPKEAKNLRRSSAEIVKNTAHITANQTELEYRQQSNKTYNQNLKLYRQNNSKVKNGDVQSSLLFGSLNGSKTRMRTKDGQESNENNATQAVINNLIGIDSAPRKVFDNQESTVAGRMYSLLQRRNAAIMGLSQYALNFIAKNHEANPELVHFFEDSQLPITEEQKENGISFSQLIDLYIEKKMSPEELKALASTTSSMTLLRTIVQNETMGLWLDVQSLNTQEQIEALKAAELALFVQDSLEHKVKQYRQDVINNE